MSLTPSRSKFGNKKAVVDGITFDSQREAGHWSELRLLEKAGKIRNLQRQVRYSLEVNGQKVTTYVADFVFEEFGHDIDLAPPASVSLMGRWKTVVADSKGFKTPEYKLKKKLMKAVLGVDVREL